MKYLHLPLKSLMLGLGLISTAACQHTDVGTPSPHETTMRNSVQMVRLPFEVQKEEDDTDSLSMKTELALSAFLVSVQAGYGDTILLDGPSVSPYRITALSDFIRARGLLFAGNVPVGPTPKNGSVILYVERHKVITPDCGGWQTEINNQQRNNDSAHFGCSTATNLGLMVANPRDLISGHSTGNSTASAVGAIYTPSPQSSGPTMTLSLEGLGNLPQANAALPNNSK